MPEDPTPYRAGPEPPPPRRISRDLVSREELMQLIEQWLARQQFSFSDDSAKARILLSCFIADITEDPPEKTLDCCPPSGHHPG